MTTPTTFETIDETFVARAHARLNGLTKPQGSLGRLEEIALHFCGWQRTLQPRTERAYTLIFAGNHGVAARGVSAFPPAVTAQMVANFEASGAAINQLSRAIPSTLRVHALSLETPTQDFTVSPAMNVEECRAAMALGASAVPEDADVIILGEMGIANTTPAAAISHFLCGGTAADWVGAGTGVHGAGLAAKTHAVETAVTLHKNSITDTESLLACLGGRELAAMAGACARARALRIPVLLDGYVATSACAALTRNDVHALSHCISGHASAEPGHIRLLNHLNLSPLLQLNMRLGEGSGAQVALALVRASLACFGGMATFESAGVAKKI